MHLFDDEPTYAVQIKMARPERGQPQVPFLMFSVTYCIGGKN